MEATAAEWTRSLGLNQPVATEHTSLRAVTRSVYRTFSLSRVPLGPSLSTDTHLFSIVLVLLAIGTGLPVTEGESNFCLPASVSLSSASSVASARQYDTWSWEPRPARPPSGRPLGCTACCRHTRWPLAASLRCIQHAIPARSSRGRIGPCSIQVAHVRIDPIRRRALSELYLGLGIHDCGVTRNRGPHEFPQSRLRAEDVRASSGDPGPTRCDQDTDFQADQDATVHQDVNGTIWGEDDPDGTHSK